MYKKGKLEEVPKSTRKSASRFEKTAEWRMMKADIDRGLKPLDALQVALTDEDKKKYKIRNRVTVARFVKKYLAAKGLDYGVKSFRNNNYDYVVVKNTPDQTKAK